MREEDITTTIYYNNEGKKCKENEFACAQRIYNSHTNVEKYFVLYGAGLFNPNEASANVRYTKNNRWKMKMVNKNIFDLYLDFLKTKRVPYLRHAERNM